MAEKARQPKKKTRATSPLQKIMVGLSLGYALLIGILFLQNALGPERAWWSTMNLYLPQVIWALPAPVLVLGMLLCGPRMRLWALLPLLLGGLVLGPLMGYANLFRLSPGITRGSRLRVMTYNIERGSTSVPHLLRLIEQEHPDLFLSQDTSGSFTDALRKAYPTWNIERTGELLVATPLPLRAVENVALPLQKTMPWKVCSYTRCLVRVGDTDVAVFNLHLVTPRYALMKARRDKYAILRGKRSLGVEELIDNAQTRVAQAEEVAKRIAQEKGPVVVAGDFNAPLASLACQKMQAQGLRDAFALAGRGYGYTFGHTQRFDEPFLRIDHIFASSQFVAYECSVSPVKLSDHLPVIVELVLP